MVATTSSRSPVQPLLSVISTQYDLVVLTLGEKLFPEFKLTELAWVSYQLNPAALVPVTFNVSTPGPQRLLSRPTGVVGSEKIVPTTSVLGPSHPWADIIDAQ
jgi:hypothetical protein